MATSAANTAPPPWGSNGVTISRQLPEQQVGILNWSGNQVRLNFQALQPYGYLRKLFLWSPYAANTAAISTAGPVPNALTQLGPYRAIARFQLTTQGASNLYDVTGEDLGVLNYYRNGRMRTGNVPNSTIYAAIVGSPGSSLPPYGSLFGTANAQYYGNFVANSGLNTTSCWFFEIPITEMFRVTSVLGSNGQPMMSDMMMELGMITLQNIQQNVSPNITLNPLYSQDYIAPFKTAGVGTVTFPSTTWNLSRDAFDVPNDPRQLPPTFLQDYIITRQGFDVPVTGGKATYNFANAGLLLRAHYLFYSDLGTLGTNGQWIDIGNGNNTQAQIQFGYGSIVNKIQETVQENLARSSARLGVAPVCLTHDFMDDQSEVQAPNTANQTNIRTLFTGLDTTGLPPTRLHVVEERLIPVRSA